MQRMLWGENGSPDRGISLRLAEYCETNVYTCTKNSNHAKFQEGPTMDNYEEQKLELACKSEFLEKMLESLSEQIEEEQLKPDTINNNMPKASTLDEVW